MSAYALDTEASTSDSEECAKICEQSLIRRSKHSPAKTYLREWKAGNLTRLRSGLISSHSLGDRFVIEWTSSLEDTHANHSPQQGSEQERMTQDTCGLGSQTEFGFCALDSASLRTSRDTSRWDSPVSSATWKSWVTRCRGEYSLRVKLAHPTNASGCSSWPTTAARDWKGCGNAVTRKDGKHRLDTLEAVVIHGKDAWQTPTTNMDMVRSEEGIQKRKEFRASIGRKSIPDGNLGEQMQRVIKHGHPAPANHSTHGSRQESWATPSTMLGSMYVEHNADKRNSPSLATQAAWATPRCSMAQDKQEDSGKHRLGEQAQHNTTGKLNPRWVETLMGLPIGWTMPSCTRPVTIAQTNCDCLETESCQQLPSEHLELF